MFIFGELSYLRANQQQAVAPLLSVLPTGSFFSRSIFQAACYRDHYIILLFTLKVYATRTRFSLRESFYSLWWQQMKHCGCKCDFSQPCLAFFYTVITNVNLLRTSDTYISGQCPVHRGLMELFTWSAEGGLKRRRRSRYVGQRHRLLERLLVRRGGGGARDKNHNKSDITQPCVWYE